MVDPRAHDSDGDDDDDDDNAVLPAPNTKHVAALHTRLPRGEAVSVRQQAVEASGAHTGTTGTTLWLGAQVLAAYLCANSPSTTSGAPRRRRTALELGAGVGYLSLTLASLGYDVTATDIEPVLSRVLAPNVAVAGEPALPGGKVVARKLDWLDAAAAEAATAAALTHDGGTPDLVAPDLAVLDATYDLVVTSDTIYAPDMTPKLWAALERACAPRRGRRPPTVYVALERRDPGVVDAALELGRERGCVLHRIAHERLVKALERAGWHWDPADWDGVEVYKGKWRTASAR